MPNIIEKYAKKRERLPYNMYSTLLPNQTARQNSMGFTQNNSTLIYIMCVGSNQQHGSERG